MQCKGFLFEFPFHYQTSVCTDLRLRDAANALQSWPSSMRSCDSCVRSYTKQHTSLKPNKCPDWLGHGCDRARLSTQRWWSTKKFFSQSFVTEAVGIKTLSSKFNQDVSRPSIKIFLKFVSLIKEGRMTGSRKRNVIIYLFI